MAHEQKATHCTYLYLPLPTTVSTSCKAHLICHLNILCSVKGIQQTSSVLLLSLATLKCTTELLALLYVELICTSELLALVHVDLKCTQS